MTWPCVPLYFTFSAGIILSAIESAVNELEAGEREHTPKDGETEATSPATVDASETPTDREGGGGSSGDTSGDIEAAGSPSAM